jgi:ATP-dependent Clp protease ATP-binding subunit ClpC
MPAMPNHKRSRPVALAFALFALWLPQRSSAQYVKAEALTELPPALPLSAPMYEAPALEASAGAALPALSAAQGLDSAVPLSIAQPLAPARSLSGLPASRTVSAPLALPTQSRIESGARSAPALRGLSSAAEDRSNAWHARFEAALDGSLFPGEKFSAPDKPEMDELLTEGLENGDLVYLGANSFMYSTPETAIPGTDRMLTESAKLLHGGQIAAAIEKAESATRVYHAAQKTESPNFVLASALANNGVTELLRRQAELEHENFALSFLTPLAFYNNDGSLAFNGAKPTNLQVKIFKELADSIRASDLHVEGPARRRVENALERFVTVMGRMARPDSEDGEEPTPPSRKTVRPNGKQAANDNVAPFALDPKKYENLSKYARNITAEAAAGKLAPVIGRKKEIEALVRTLIRWTKSNPVLIGEAGVGKSAIVEGLSQEIAKGSIPELKDRVILSLDLGAMIAGTQYRGQFEERVKGVLEEARSLKGKAILFADELHTILGLGSASGSSDMASLIKPALARGEISLIGATTLDEFRKIEKDKALARRFKPIMVQPPSQAEAVDILRGLQPEMSKHHGGLVVEPDAVEASVVLSGRYIRERQWPDKAIDVLDEAMSRVRMRKGTSVAVEDVAQVVSEWGGVPVSKLNENEMEALRALPGKLKSEVINQDEASEKVARSIKRNRVGLSDPNRPMGSFVFLGPTGVGKTELARAIARNQFGDEKAMVRFDMSEYMEKHTVSRLIGAPPGYVGFEGAGLLTEAVRRNPYSVVLFDEIEKAHPDVLNVLLQVLDEGQLTDSHGTVVDFRNTIIVMTSNIGGAIVKAGGGRPIGFHSHEDLPGRDKMELPGSQKDIKAGYEAAFRSYARPEFLNRIDAVLVFNRLSRADVAKILELQLSRLQTRLGKRLTIEVTDAAKAFLLEKGYDAELGARPLKRAITSYVEDLLTDEFVEGRLSDGDTAVVDIGGEGLAIRKK